MPKERGLILGLSFFVISGHPEGWRLSDRDNDRETLDYYRDLAKLSEDALLHFMFLGDSLDGASQITRGWTPSIDPVVLASALAAETQTLGFIPSTSSLYQDPFTLARALASLDHLNKGRTGWNILTSFYKDTARHNYTTGRDFRYEDRYEISADFIKTVVKFWHAWQPGAIIRDKESGYYADPEKVQPISHRGPYFQVDGALNVSRSPQEVPVMFVPVSSPQGQDFASAYGEVIFNRQNNFADMQTFYRTMKEKARGHGRSPDDIVVTPGAIIVLGDTEEEARRNYERITAYIDHGKAFRQLESLFGWQENQVAASSRADSWPEIGSETGKVSNYAKALIEKAKKQNLAFEDLALEAAASRGFLLLIGTAQSVADTLQHWYENEAVDGFVVGPIVAPDGVDDIATKLVPELQRRGLFRSDAPKGQTLRQALGLKPYLSTQPEGFGDA